MFEEMFETMNEALDHVIEAYPVAQGQEKDDLEHTLNVLKDLSDTFIEEWLQFEEKMGLIHKVEPEAKVKTMATTEEMESKQEVEAGVKTDDFQKGEGFFKLLMYKESVNHFELVIQNYPELMMARIYLSLGLMELQELDEAYQHLRFIAYITDNDKEKAIAYHAMGCIQVNRNHLDKACDYFKLANKTDPSLSYYSLS